MSPVTYPTLYLYNTLTRQKDRFVPIDPNHIRMYVCGPTVYSFAHIGNARPVVVFDLLYRLLKLLYPGEKRVTYVRNITDIDDKIIEESKKTGEPINEITTRTTDFYFSDMRNLGALDPDLNPKATEHVSGMILMIQDLIAKGFAYEAEGHVLFQVASFPKYGELSKLDQEQIIAGARVETAPYKKEPGDFVLWKPSTDDQPGWFSPWGRGRPGWHIECSVMSFAYLGKQFDIHGGGLDLIFPHHENEIAQSCCAHDTDKMANYWIHNGYLTLDQQKMSKSLGNILTVHQLLEDWDGEVIRYALLSGHYPQPLNFSFDLLKQSKAALDRLYGALKDAPVNIFGQQKAALEEIARYQSDHGVISALCDDLNTPLALSHLFEIAGLIYKTQDQKRKIDLQKELFGLGYLLGLLNQDPQAWFTSKQGSAHSNSLSSEDIEKLIEERQQAKLNRDFKRADDIRDIFKSHHIILEDSASGTTWRYD